MINTTIKNQPKKRSYLIGISGGSGSGKTFFLNCFLRHFKSSDISFISQDDYYVRPDGLTPEEITLYNFDLPSRIDSERFVGDIRKISSGKTVYQKKYLFNHQDHSDPTILEISPAPIIVVEGLFVFHFQKIAKLFDMKIFIDADEDIALGRRIKRDIEERNYNVDNVMYRWVNQVLPAYKTYLLPHKKIADKIIPNSSNIPDDLLLITEEISRDLKKYILRTTA